MTQEPTIDARGLHLTFETNDGPVHALQDVNLKINKGDFVSFIGPSGCGKTTFLRCIAGLETPTSGHISVNGLTPDEAHNTTYPLICCAKSVSPLSLPMQWYTQPHIR